MERTISFMNGEGSIGHNTRRFIADNVDASRTPNNITLIHEDIKQAYHKLFDKALEEYNAKQKRKDRKIKNYYDKISRSKQEKLFYEGIVQIGNKDDTGVGGCENSGSYYLMVFKSSCSNWFDNSIKLTVSHKHSRCS